MKFLYLILAIVGAAIGGVLIAKISAPGEADSTDSGSSAGTASPPLNPLTDRVAVAIAAAEGFPIVGSVPNRNHNPGDLRLDITGKGTGKDPLGFIVYANDSDGWDALRRQVSLMLNNQSHVYNRDMTIAEIAKKYTATAQAEWASIVAQHLGVSIDTRLSDI